MQRVVTIGTRTSALALWQTHWVVKRLQEKNPDYQFRIKELKTKGDKILDVALAKIGDKGLFTKELELALLSKEIDLAVHSMKDVPTELPQGLVIGAVTEREEPCDVLLSPQGYNLDRLPRGAKVGTSSLRRKAQLLYCRPDLRIEDLRGNLNTRIEKMQKEQFDAIVLAFAGVERMGWAEYITQRLPFEIMLPAVSQGALGIEVREEDQEILELVRTIEDLDSKLCVTAERAFLRRLEGGCQIPIGALAAISDQGIKLEGVIASLDGSRLIRDNQTADTSEALSLGTALADKLLSLGGDDILQQVRKETEV